MGTIRYRTARQEVLKFTKSDLIIMIIIITIIIILEASNKLQASADLFAVTEDFLTAIQDQVIPTRNYKKYIL
jgi:hypothetical protein